MKKINKINYSVILLVLVLLFSTVNAFAAPSLVPKSTTPSAPISTKKFKVDTLAKSVTKCHNLTIDKNNNIYYLDFYNNESNKLFGIVNGVKTLLADGGNETNREVDFMNLVYDKALDRVLLLCNFNSAYNNGGIFQGSSLVYDIKDLSKPIAIFQQGCFTWDDKPVMDGNTIIDHGFIFDLDELTIAPYVGDYESVYATFIGDQFTAFMGSGFTTYDLSSDSTIDMPVIFDGIKSIDAITSFNNKFYLYSADNRSFYEVDTTVPNPKATLYASSTGITVKDRFPFGNVSEFTFCNDGTIIFYDATNKAIRRMTDISTAKTMPSTTPGAINLTPTTPASIQTGESL